MLAVFRISAYQVYVDRLTNYLSAQLTGYETDQQLAVVIFRRIHEVFNGKALAPVVVSEDGYPGPKL